MNLALWRRVLEERRRVILPLAIALIANLAVLLLAVLPMQTGLAAAESEERKALADLADARRLEQRTREIRASQQQADETLGEFYSRVLPGDLAVARKTTNLWLQQAAQDAGLTFKTGRFATEPIRESRLSRASATILLEGRYPDIRRFLYALETAEEFIVIDQVNLAQADNGQIDGSGRLSVEVVVSTYYLTPSPR